MADEKKLTSYEGPFQVELWNGGSTTNVSKISGVVVRGTVVSVEHGTVQQVMGGIQFYADDKRFSWGYRFIKRILDETGNILWENWDLKETDEPL